ncbi:MAG: potassium/proton antiporter [Lentisphaerae bacterium]|nr:potassium/proton antiporter [Lentisphaerota bacterium]
MTATDSIIAIAGFLLLAGAFSNKISSRFNLPTLLLFMAAGIFAESILPFNGENYAGQINFFGIAAMCFILFSGGSDTSLSSIRPVALRGILLAMPGVVITALITGIGAFFLLRFEYSFLWCLLLGAIISSTDAAAVFSILRGKGISLKGDLKQLLELESGSNDPTAAFLTLLMIGLVLGTGQGIMVEIPLVVYQLGGGIFAGIFFGWAGRKLFKMKLDYEGLYFVVSVALVLLCYGLTQLLGANGFMSCYVCGIYLNSQRYNYQKALCKFHNGIAWLMQVGLFTVLGFLADPGELISPAIWIPGVALGLLLMFVARPAAVFICLAKSKYSLKEKLMISWVGIRGAAPIVLATFPLAAGVENAALMFRLIFFMVILSITFQGWLLMPVAKMLHLAREADDDDSPAPLELEVTEGSAHQEMEEFRVTEKNPIAGKTLAEIGFPKGVLVTMIRRDGSFIPPGGDTRIQSGDGMLIMAEIPLLQQVKEQFFTEVSTPEKNATAKH